MLLMEKRIGISSERNAVTLDFKKISQTILNQKSIDIKLNITLI